MSHLISGDKKLQVSPGGCLGDSVDCGAGGSPKVMGRLNLIEGISKQIARMSDQELLRFESFMDANSLGCS